MTGGWVIRSPSKSNKMDFAVNRARARIEDTRHRKHIRENLSTKGNYNLNNTNLGIEIAFNGYHSEPQRESTEENNTAYELIRIAGTTRTIQDYL